MTFRASLLLLLVVPPALSGQTLSLVDAKDLARTRNESILIERASVEQAERAAAIARALRLPSVDVDGSYNFVSEYAKIPVNIPLPGIASRSVNFGDGNTTLFGLTASVPLFTGFRLAAQQQMRELATVAARHTLEGRTLELMTQVTLAYRGAQLALSARTTLEDQRGYMERVLETSRALQRGGQALPYDTLVLSTRLSELRLGIAQAESEHRTFLLQLSQLTGRSTPFDVENDLLGDSPLAALSVDSLVQLAFATRPDLQGLAIAKRIGAEKERSATGSYYPSVAGFAAYKYGRPGVDAVANEWMGYYTAGVQLKWNVWAWGADREQVQISALDIRKTELQESQLRRQIRTSVERLMNDLTVLNERAGLLDEQIAAEEAKSRMLQLRYKQGLATTVEVVDGESSLTRARLLRDQNRISTSMKFTELAAAVGLEY